MSEMEFRVGKIKEIDLGLSLDETCKKVCNNNGINTLQDYNSWAECLDENYYEKYIVANGKLYEVIQDTRKNDADDIYEITKDTNGELNYTLYYYNGGCSFSEAIEEALSRMKNKE